VLYSRKISYTVQSGLSAGQVVTFSVQGPGARLKVFVDNAGKVVGTQGGWREVVETATNANRPTVAVMEDAQARALYQALGESVNLAPTTFQAVTRTILNSTLAYYEQEQGVAMSQLIPSWVFDVVLANDTGSVTTTAYIPANAELLPPLAKITSNGGTTVTVSMGTAISLTAADASLTLAQNGLDSSLNFVAGKPAFTYTWKVATSGRVIGTGRSINYNSALADLVGTKGQLLPIPVMLEVKDANGQTSTATQNIVVTGISDVKTVYLPTVLR
jgi:hypothetical protein